MHIRFPSRLHGRVERIIAAINTWQHFGSLSPPPTNAFMPLLVSPLAIDLELDLGNGKRKIPKWSLVFLKQSMFYLVLLECATFYFYFLVSFHDSQK